MGFWERRTDASRHLRWHFGGGELRLREHVDRVTAHRRVQRSDGTWSLADRDLPVARADAEEFGPTLARLADQLVGSVGDGWRCEVGLDRLDRSYHNRDGIHADICEDSWSLTTRSPRGQLARETVLDVLDLPAAYHRARIRADQTAPQPVADSVPAGLPFVLAPAAASVLVHELVAHAVEERDIRPGDRVLSPGSAVTVIPRRPGCDDEGVPSHALQIIEGGVVTRDVGDRAGPTPPAGHSWCGAHLAPPRVRLTHLTVSGGTAVAAPRRHVWCERLSGGRYFHGRAVLEVQQAWLVDADDPMTAVRPFRLVVSHRDTATGAMLGSIPGPVLGTCVKDGDLLSSEIVCGAFLLERAGVWP
jgi:hypothetical protein